jgi:RNA polymerase sigma factor (sigma-70 family)
LAQLFATHGAIYRRLAYRYLDSNDDAEDAVQNAFLRAIERHHQFRGQSLLSGWVMRILQRECLDQLRLRARRPAEELDERHAGAEEFPMGDLLLNHWRSAVLQHLFRLTAGERRFLGRVLDDEDLNMSLPGNKSLRHRVLTKLRFAVQRKTQCRN